MDARDQTTKAHKGVVKTRVTKYQKHSVKVSCSQLNNISFSSLCMWVLVHTICYNKARFVRSFADVLWSLATALWLLTMALWSFGHVIVVVGHSSILLAFWSLASTNLYSTLPMRHMTMCIPLYTIAKGSDHQITRAIESHPNA